jgi:HlyD family secretion protein
LEQAETDFRIAEETYRAAVFAARIAQYELELAEAAQAQTTSDSETPATRFKIVSPIDGVVLDVLQTSSKIVVPGDTVDVNGWGGAHTLSARVRLVEPSAFTHISALGVEEQRVNVIADFVGSADQRTVSASG